MDMFMEIYNCVVNVFMVKELDLTLHQKSGAEERDD